MHGGYGFLPLFVAGQVPSIDCPKLISAEAFSAVMYELALRFQHRCPYSDLSRMFPLARISLWDNLQKEFLDVRSNYPKDWPRLSRELRCEVTKAPRSCGGHRTDAVTSSRQ